MPINVIVTLSKLAKLPDAFEHSIFIDPYKIPIFPHHNVEFAMSFSMMYIICWILSMRKLKQMFRDSKIGDFGMQRP